MKASIVQPPPEYVTVTLSVQEAQEILDHLYHYCGKVTFNSAMQSLLNTLANLRLHANKP